MRAIFQVREIHEIDRGCWLMRLESTQVTAEIFACRCDLIVPSVEAKMGLKRGAEVMIEVQPMPREIAKAAAAPLR